MEIQQIHSIQENRKKVEELFSTEWIKTTWQNFVECLKANSNYGK